MTQGVTSEMLPGALRFMFPLFKLLTRPDGGKSAATASRASVYLAASADVAGVSGKYFDTNNKMGNGPNPFSTWMRASISGQLLRQLPV